MNSYFDFEYYPKINPKIIERHKQIIISNRDKWEKPFFTDSTSYLDLAKIEGVAKCHPTDTFDAEIGTEIAYGRVMQKMLGLPMRLKWQE